MRVGLLRVAGATGCAVLTLGLFNVAPTAAAPDLAPAAHAGVTAVSTGYEHSLALLDNNTVVAWGANKFGQLGIGTVNSAYRPLAVCAVGVISCPPGSPSSSYLHGVTAIAAGAFFSMALVDGGGVVTWGRSGEGSKGSLGNGTTRGNDCGGGCQTVPVAVCAMGVTSCLPGSPAGSFLHGVRAIAAGTAFALAILDDNTVLAWGSNILGQLGNAQVKTTSPVPVAVCAVKVRSCEPGSAPAKFLSGVTSVSAGDTFALALKNNAVIAWGNNTYGELGVGTVRGPESCSNKVSCSHAPLAVTKLNMPVSAISAGNYHGLAIVDRPLGTPVGIESWGSNTNGQVGFQRGTACNGNCQTTPVPVLGHWKGLTAVAGGASYSLALVDGRVMAWGSNHVPGRLGNGLTKNAHEPVAACAVGVKLCPPGSPSKAFLQGVSAITAGGTVSLALVGKSVVVWGSNYKGALGIGSTKAGGTAFPIKLTALG